MMDEAADMAKASDRCDVLILGGHPAAYLAAALLRVKPALHVIHAGLDGEDHSERLVLVNPEFFTLHKLLGPLAKKLTLSAMYGLKFLADKPGLASEYRSRTVVGYVGQYGEIRAAMKELATESGARVLEAGDEVELGTPHQHGVDIQWNSGSCCAKMLMVAGGLDATRQRTLGLAQLWGQEILHRITLADVPASCAADGGKHPVIPMSLDLKGSQAWAWTFINGNRVQLMVSQPMASVSAHRPGDLIRWWGDVLQQHGVLTQSVDWNSANVLSMDLPLGGALENEGVADRTILVGPAGGFYSACSEDIYPNCWSAVHACNVLRKALKETHLQDALAAYRSSWRTTLGDYLRGPQQNLRFLLPLVYRNQVMTNRLGESILLGKSVVR